MKIIETRIASHSSDCGLLGLPARSSAGITFGAMTGVSLSAMSDTPPKRPIPAIPTKYKGIQFRSRLEAKWACMFDQLNWVWEYEPRDLNGYIPDFVLHFKKPTLAEIKPASTFSECRQHIPKLTASGWGGDVLIFGDALKLGPDSFLGPECCLYGQVQPGPGDELLWDWQPGEMHKCSCGVYSIYHTVQSYRAITCGHYCGQNHLLPVDFAEVHSFWARATNTSKFNFEDGEAQ